MAHTVRFGILGAGNIARRFAASLSCVSGADLMAVSCRTQEKADAAALALKAKRAYAGYDALLADPDVDAIYLSLPHRLHFEWALKALEAGKPVLCEKPAMITAEEMNTVAAMAHKKAVLFMEAMKPRFVPIHTDVMEAIAHIGTLTHIEATLCNDMLGSVAQSGSYHMTPGPGAGVLLDCGTYCASWIEELCDGLPTVNSVTEASVNDIDTYVDARLSFGSMDARLECAFDRAKPRTATIWGSKGHIVVDELHRPQHATLYLKGEEPQELLTPYEIDDFYGEVSHFVNLVQEGSVESPIMPLKSSVCCAQILDAIRTTFPTNSGLAQ